MKLFASLLGIVALAMAIGCGPDYDETNVSTDTERAAAGVDGGGDAVASEANSPQGLRGQ